jgi:hypothetical protein
MGSEAELVPVADLGPAARSPRTYVRLRARRARRDDPPMKNLVLISVGVLVALVFAVSAFASEKTYTVAMSGKQESPKGDPDGKGTATVKIEASKGEVCFKFTWSRIGTPTAAHIHKGKKGVAGPVVVPFFGGAAKHSGCVKASKSLLSKIVKSPGSYYVNLHNAKYPNGALRGQL